MSQYTKDPTEDLDYTRTWAKWLGQVDDTISSSIWVIPEGLEVGSGVQGHTDLTATVWLKGGTSGHRYKISNVIVTEGGRTAKRSFFLDVQPR